MIHPRRTVRFLLVAWCVRVSCGFMLSQPGQVATTRQRPGSCLRQASDTMSSSSSDSGDKTRAYRVPLNPDEMIKQVASAMKQAAQRGMNRQVVRILLPRPNPTDDRDGEWLVPPDESWQGGIMQLYRVAAPTCEAILRQYCQDVLSARTSGLPARIREDRSVDDSGVDGVGLFRTDDQSLSCWLQPLQETVEDYVITASKKASPDDVLVLMNPQWREADDALDTASKGDGVLSGLASFLGGKGSTLKKLKMAGFVPVYSLEQYVCRGANVRLLQMVDSDWNVFCERDDGETFLRVGACPDRPTYQQVEEMLQESDIGYKYSRDMGLSPRL